MPKRPILLSLALLASPAIQAQGGSAPGATPDAAALQACAAIGAPADRLDCYDRALGRAVEAPPPLRPQRQRRTPATR